MAVYDILPSTHLRGDDIRDTLNANGGTAINEMLSFFKEEANIRKYAKYKPVWYDSINPYSDPDWWNGKPKDGDMAKTTIGGLLIGDGFVSLFGGKQSVANKIADISADVNGFLYKLAKGTTGMWEYVRPTKYFRCGDFRGYAAKAVNPHARPIAGTYTYDTAVNIKFEFPTQVLGGLTLADLVLPSNISNASPSISDYYVGILLYNSDLTDVMWVTQTEAQKQKGTNAVTLLNNANTNLTGRKGVYKARTFYSSKPIELNALTYPQPISLLSCDTDEYSIALVDASLGEVHIEVSGKFIDQGNSRFQCICTVYNGTALAKAVTSVQFIQSDFLSTITNGNTGTVDAFGSFNSSVTINFPERPITVKAVVDGKTYTGTIN